MSGMEETVHSLIKELEDYRDAGGDATNLAIAILNLISAGEIKKAMQISSKT